MHARNRSLMIGLCLLLPLGACGGGLQLNLLKTSVQRPSNVALYFSVETSNGEPVGGLEAESFQIYEDEQLISTFESKQTILNPEVAVVHYTLLLLDLSGSITESGSLHSLIQAASSFSERVTKKQQMAIYGFDGSPKLIPLVSSFTSNARGATAALSRLSTRKSRDPSTNLNGAVVEAIKVLEKRMARSRQPLRFGTLVVFTDGTDRAHRVTEEKMHEAIDQATVNIFAIGLGAEISKGSLSKLGRNGFVQATEQGNISEAFDAVAESIENASRKFYLLSYCSPSRAGKHTLSIKVKAKGQSGELTHEFDATRFGPKCDPKRAPKFQVGRLLLNARKKKGR